VDVELTGPRLENGPAQRAVTDPTPVTRHHAARRTSRRSTAA
jgi:hypothetical protein